MENGVTGNDTCSEMRVSLIIFQQTGKTPWNTHSAKQEYFELKTETVPSRMKYKLKKKKNREKETENEKEKQN